MGLCAWAGHLNLNFSEKTNAEIKTILKDCRYTSQRLLRRYGIFADPRLEQEWGIFEVLAGVLSAEAQLIAQRPATVAAPVFTAAPAMFRVVFRNLGCKMSKLSLKCV